MRIPPEMLAFIREHGTTPTLSVYIEGTPADPAARRRWRVRLRQGLREVRTSLAASEAELAQFVGCEADLLSRVPDSDFAPSASGWGCFCPAGGEALVFQLPHGFAETEVMWGRGPHLVPLLRTGIEERALVVRLDLEHAHIGRWVDGTLTSLATYEADRPQESGSKMGDAPRQGFHGGTRGHTRKDDEARQRADGQERLRAQVLEAVITHAGTDLPVVVGGPGEATSRLVAALPPTVATRTTVAPAIGLRTDDHGAPAHIRAALATIESAARQRRVEELLEEVHPNGHATRGLAGATAAAEAGAIAELLFTEQAWRADPTAIESLVRRALVEGGSVGCAHAAVASTLDDDAEGVIAALRFPFPTPR